MSVPYSLSMGDKVKDKCQGYHVVVLNRHSTIVLFSDIKKYTKGKSQNMQ